VVGIYAYGLHGPSNPAFDAAGNLFVAQQDGTVDELAAPPATAPVTVPFTLGGTAVAGVDFSGVTASPLVIPAGQTSGAITGTLFSDPGPSQSLIITLGAPPGAHLGSPSAVTLTIDESGSAVVITPSTAYLPATATTLVINGFGFSADTAEDIVNLGSGVTFNISSATSTRLVLTGLSGLVPGALDATVTVDGVSSGVPAPVVTVVAAPAVTGVSPSTGSTSGGTTVTIDGTALADATEVDFGSAKVTSFISDSATSITLTSPAAAAATVDVQVVTPGGTSAIVPADEFTFAVPPTASITEEPANPTNSTSAAFAFTGSDNSTPADQLTFAVSLDGGTFVAATSPVSYSSLASASHTFQVEAIDQAGIVSSVASYTWIIDTTPPTASVTQKPTNPTASATATFAFTGSDNVTPSNKLTFEVSLDGSTFTAAPSPFVYANLALGSHTFEVEAIDQAGNVSSAVSYTWTIVPAGSISGTVFHDYNTNGVQDSGEPGLAGITVYLDLKQDGTLDSGDPTAITNASGAYTFSGLTPGPYTVREILLGGMLLSEPSTGSYQATVTSGVTTSNQNFGDVVTSITVPLTLQPTTAFPSQGNANADYVEAVYRAVLDRNADPGGLTSWTGDLNDGSYTRLQVVQGIRNSPEHFTQEVDAYYQTLLGRAADAVGQAYWVGQLEGGLAEEKIAAAFLNSPEYLSKGDKYFVDSMYESLLGRTFDSTGEAYWLSQLGDNATGYPTGSPPTLTHAQVVTDFLYSTESLQRLVEGYYEDFLQRQADSGGLKSWVTELQDGLPFLTIGEEFLSSDEFYNNAAGNK
jgi:hypothetical protein